MSSIKTNLTPEQALAIANQLLQSRQSQKALQILIQAHNQHPENEQLSLKLSRLLQQYGQTRNAIIILLKTYQSSSTSFELDYFLAALLHIERDLSLSEEILLKALKKKPDSAAGYNLLGINRIEQNRYEDAVSAYRSSIEFDPRSADAYNNLAWAYRAMGKKKEAIANFEKAFELDPNATESLSGLLMLKSFTKKTKEFEVVESRLKDKSLNYKQSTELNFALGKAYEEIKNYKRAFECFKTGNNLWRQHLTYNIKTDEKLFSHLKNIFTKDYISKHKLSSDSADTIQPIFIIGMPRSSTTLIEQILSSHSSIVGGGELPFLDSLLLDKNQHLTWPKQPTIKSFQAIATEYLEKMYSHVNKDINSRTQFITDKLPQNFRLIGAILCLFPKAKIIHCKRDPMDTCLSLYKHHFPMANHHYAYNQQELAHYYALYESLMKHWHTVAPDQIFDIQYEDLLDNLDGRTQAMLDFCGLKFETECIQFQNNQRIVRTASSDQVRKGLYKDAAGKWKVYNTELTELKTTLQSYS